MGGEDFDNIISDWVCDEFRKKTKLDLKTNPKAMRRLRTSVERAKRVLSTSTQATIEVDSILDGQDLSIVLSRAKFESLCESIFRKAMEPVEQAMKDAKMSKTDIHDIVLVGGSTRIPKIQQLRLKCHPTVMMLTTTRTWTKKLFDSPAKRMPQ